MIPLIGSGRFFRLICSSQLGPWVYLWGNGVVPVAEEHISAFSGRSRFLVFLRLPGGRKATLDYLRTLWEFPEPWSPHPGDPNQVVPSPKLPQFPAGTEVALVRQMMTFERSGELMPTPIANSCLSLRTG